MWKISFSKLDHIILVVGDSYTKCFTGQITQDESIFTYAAGESVATFSDPDHVPPFLDEIQSSLEGNSTLVEVCGNNPLCLFDAQQTGDVNAGMATMQFQGDAISQSMTLGMYSSTF